ncbi:MAG: cytochrome c biogenesis protein CcdA [Holosporales bacterium]
MCNLSGMISRFLLVTNLLFSLLYPAFGMASTDPAQVTFLQGVKSIPPEAKEIFIGAEIKLDPGWKIYAPSQNDEKVLGQSAEIILEAQKNVKNIEILWPPAAQLQAYGIRFLGYEGRVILPIKITLANPGKGVAISGRITFSACKDLCLMMDTPFSVALTSGRGELTADALRIEHARHHSPAEHSPETATDDFFVMLFFAFFGGLILNFMPCVLPVLMLKVVSVAKVSHRAVERHHLQAGFFATAAGIVTSFLILGGITASLDYMGEQVGWGTHFQQPGFVAFMVVILTFFALNLWGFFDIDLSYKLQQRLNDWVGLGDHVTHLLGDFLAGMFATLMATPCTAPFLGAALGFAFTLPPQGILLFFLVMGLGFAAPYLLGAMAPRLLLRIPKPGHWMQTLSRMMAVALGLSAFWLLHIFWSETSTLQTLILGAGLLVVILGFSWRGAKKLHVFSLMIAGGLSIASVYLPIQPMDQRAIPQVPQGLWQPFEPQKIPTFVAEGKVVLVEVTAAWCLTCKVNEMTVFGARGLTTHLQSPKIVAMKADFTQRQETIQAFLTLHQRRGIPFTIVYGPKAPQGIILSELLSEKEVIDALNQAGYTKE